MEKTLEHLAWEILVERLEYLNTFAGNRSENARFWKEVKEALQKAKEQNDTAWRPMG